jgi:transmembrane sensor
MKIITMEQQKALIIAEMSGVITPEEQEYLDQLRKDDPAIQLLSDQLYEELAPDKIGLNDYVPPTAAEIMALVEREEEHQQPKRRSFSRYILPVAACILAAMFLIKKIYKQPGNEKQPVITPIVQQEYDLRINGQNVLLGNAVVLKVRDGKLITNDKWKFGDTVNAIKQEQVSIQFLENSGHISNDQNTSERVLYQHSDDDQMIIASLHVPRRRHMQVILEDGTVVMVNADSKLEFPISNHGKNRNISIDGEAYIDVTPNAEAPMFVHTDSLKVQVLGTKFNINTYWQEEKVSLIQGSVKVTKAGRSQLLKPSEEIFSSVGVFDKRSFSQEDATAWLTGKINFKDATLQVLKQAVKQFYDVDLKIDTSVTEKHCMFNINLNKPVEVCLAQYAQINNLVYDTTNHQHILKQIDDTQ